MRSTVKVSSKDKLLDAAFSLIRQKGYTNTSVDDLCHEAGVTKGSFFHYFESKEALAVAAAKHWTNRNVDFFGDADYHKHKDPLDRFLGYIDFRKQILRGKIPEFTCLVGTLVQEMHATSPAIRDACFDSIFGHAKSLEQDISDAVRLHKPKGKIVASELATHTQAVIQGAFILAKASGSAEIAAESIDHLKRYVLLLFNKQ